MGSNPEYIILSERIIPEGQGSYSAICPELGLATFSSTAEKASRRLSNAVMGVLNTATQQGEVDAYLTGLKVPIHELSVDAIIMVDQQPDPVTGRHWVHSSIALTLGARHVPYIYFPT